MPLFFKNLLSSIRAKRFIFFAEKKKIIFEIMLIYRKKLSGKLAKDNLFQIIGYSNVW